MKLNYYEKWKNTATSLADDFLESGNVAEADAHAIRRIQRQPKQRLGDDRRGRHPAEPPQLIADGPPERGEQRGNGVVGRCENRGEPEDGVRDEQRPRAFLEDDAHPRTTGRAKERLGAGSSAGGTETSTP